MLAHIKWLHYCLREAGHCIDGGTCHHECGSKGECWRQDGCVPLTGSRLTDDWKLPAPSPTDEARATIMDACQSISRSADALKDCHTVDGDWGDDLDAKAFYDAELQLLARLTALLDQPGRPVPRAEVTDAARAGEAS
ncbi:hypothetical protein WJ05_17540 [Burkholderia vietnamiensis]|nr:hypothetical protein WJ05_17540 [Burkholderia vietnamiensis]